MSKSGKSSAIDAELVRQLADLLTETGLSEIEYGRDDWHVRVSKGGGGFANHGAAPAPSTPAPAPPSLPTPAAGPAAESTSVDDLSNHPGAVTSPMVGVVYTAADPDSPPYIKVGDQVSEGDTVLLIEAMKVFNPIRAPKSGKVSRILVSGGTPVEYGEPLLIIE